MAHRFNVIPQGIPGKPEPFNLQVPEDDVSELKQLLSASKIGPATWWNERSDDQFGVSREWLIKAKDTWLATFDWRKHEERINKLPNFKIPIDDPDAGQFDIHFAALFSTKKDAIPIIFMHGWPGSFLEFLPMMDLLVEKYTPETLPYHVIVPSIPEYGLSSRTNRSAEVTLGHAARIMNQLMIDLGFGRGYMAQGGDVGSMLSRYMSVHFEACKAIHVNLLSLSPNEPELGIEGLSPEEVQHLERSKAWRLRGMGYAVEHGTRPATIGLVVSSNPLALLAWIGEKLLEWVDSRQPLPLDTILAMASFYWFTSTFPRSLYPYRTLVNGQGPTSSREKPLGYSVFPHEIFVLPKAWAEQMYPNLVTYTTHTEGGHFAAIERPAPFLADVEDFAGKLGDLFGV